MITALAYIGIRATRPDDWSPFAEKLLGMQQVDAGAGIRHFRMDDRRQRLIITPEASDGLQFLGWEVDDLDATIAHLESHGITMQRGPAAERHCDAMAFFQDPAGNRHEIIAGAHVADTPFAAGRAISGFRTGALGMGHAVIHVADAPALLPFYRDVLGFSLSDYGLTPFPLYFFHVNGRHHSFAMVGSGQAGLHHFMVELGCLDDVGQGYDLATLQQGRVALTLGRHTNDHMTSFYVNTPSGFFVEYGWGGRVIDPPNWQASEFHDGPSLWGHERLHLPDGPRQAMRQLRLDAAARGLRAPVYVADCPWFTTTLATH